MDYFQIQDAFTQRMLEDHQKGMLNDSILEPYFDWKSGKGPIPSLAEARNMVSVVVGKLEEMYDHHPDAIGREGEDPNDPWRQYAGYGKDKYLVSYLEGIDAEVTNWIIAGILDDNK